MPPAIKRALVREVARRSSNLNDVAVELLAERHGVPFSASGRHRRVIPGAAGAVVLRMPTRLREALKTSARERGQNVNDLVLATLADALEIPFVSNRKDTMASINGSSNGRVRSEDKVRVALIGVGNCANSLLQGVEYYKDADPDQFVPGLMHVDLGGYHVRDVEFTAAFDVTTDKVGKDLADAIWAHPNDTYKFADVPKTGIKVSRGMTHDGLGKYISEVVEKAPGDTDDIVGILKETGTDVVVNYLPVGSEEATKWYTEQILQAGCAMVNCMPVFIAKGGYFGKRFEDAGLPIIGDDIKSQVGATITHRVLTSLFRERGVHLDRTMQLNVGGNSDFLNMLERDRLESKKISKTNAVTSMLDYDMGTEERPRRPVGLRAVADRPQVGVHPHGGHLLRRRPAERRAEARGLGLAELGRHRHRRRPDGEARPEQRHLGRPRGPERVPHEVAAQADRRRRGVRGRRELHQEVRAQEHEDVSQGDHLGTAGRPARTGRPSRAYPMSRQLPDGFELDDDRERVDVGEVHRFLAEESYWAVGRPLETVERLVREATRVVGLYGPDGRQLGFARAVSDGVAFAYLADVYVHPDARGRGLGLELVREMIERGPLAGVKWLLHTDDGHGLYERLGFDSPSRLLMERQGGGGPATGGRGPSPTS